MTVTWLRPIEMRLRRADELAERVAGLEARVHGLEMLKIVGWPQVKREREGGA